MMQVTNLLKELKNNSSSGHTGLTSNPPTLHHHFEENSLKVQDLERTLSVTNQANADHIERLRQENQNLRRRIDQMDKDLDLQRGDLANMIKQKHSKSELAAYYQQHAKDQAVQLRKLEKRLETQAAKIVETSQENERLRAEKRMIVDQSEQLREEAERIKAKVGNYKAIIKVKENKIREILASQEQKQRKIADLED